jgi:hypothetical protein
VTASAGQVSSTTPVESLEPTDMQVDADFLERRLGGQDGGSRVRPSWKDTPRS